MTPQKMLDNAATASQSAHLLEPTTRGAVLRAVHQWIEARHAEGFYVTPHQLLTELESDEEFDL